ncbi:MAG TPA: GGDEF domain-containing protein [Candidatus Krumholzibacteria bacterium]|nr:GGDEF domain-containing protein [Candidatus Krumholzibacteria bacterium]
MSDPQARTGSYAELEKRIRLEILPLFELAIAGGQAVYRNPNLSFCWEAIEAEPCRCKAIEDSEVDESLLADADLLSDPRHGGVPAYEACRQCPVAKQIRPSVVEELGEAFNTLIHRLTERENLIANAANLTRSLASSLEDMDHENRVIRTQMIRDVLTGCYNRHHMNDRLLKEVERCQGRRRKLSVLMLDLDDFKRFNDTFGHLEGDKVLSRFGRHLRESLRDYDMAFRYGGEEFLVMLPDTDTQGALIVAERIRKGFGTLVFEVPATPMHASECVSMTVSIGLAEYRGGLSALELLEEADQALYRAKNEGKDRIETNANLLPV